MGSVNFVNFQDIQRCCLGYGFIGYGLMSMKFGVATLQLWPANFDEVWGRYAPVMARELVRFSELR